MDFKKELNELKDSMNWTYKRISIESGISYNTLLRVFHEDNREGTTIYTLERLLNAFGYELTMKPMKGKLFK